MRKRLIRPDVDMTTGPLFTNIWRYTLPIMLANVLQMLYSTVDMMIVGRFCGSLTVAAIGATAALSGLLTSLFIGLSIGVGVVVAHGLGAGRRREVRHAVHTAIPVAVLCGGVLTVGGLLLTPAMLRLTDTPTDIFAMSSVYLRIIFAGMIPNMVFNFGAAVQRAAGDSKRPMYYLAASGLLHILLDLLFVGVLPWGVAGVAVSTVLSQALSMVLVLVALCRREDACRLEWCRLRVRKKPLLQIVRIGLPTGIQTCMNSFANVLLQSSVNSFGAAAISGNSAGSTIDAFAYTLMNAFTATAMNFTSQNMGAAQYDRVRRVLRICLGCAVPIGILSGVILVLAGEPLLTWYIPDSPEAVAIGVRRLYYIGLGYFLAGIQDVLSSIIRGMGRSVSPMIISILGVCGLRVVWTYWIFPLWRTMDSLYISYLVSWALISVALLVVYRKVMGGYFRSSQRIEQTA